MYITYTHTVSSSYKRSYKTSYHPWDDPLSVDSVVGWSKTKKQNLGGTS